MINYTNPVVTGFYPDPSICRVGEDYYLATSSFEYLPGVPLFHSRDLVNWRQIGHALARDTPLDFRHIKASGGIFAPTLRHHDGRFYIVTTDTTGIGNFIIHATDPAGPWSAPVPVPLGGIDPSLFFHEGRVWFTSNGTQWGDSGIYFTEIDLASGQPVREPIFLWTGIGGKYPEAPHLYHRDGWFYLLIAEGGTEFGHMVTVARSRDITGPYASCPHNPILSHRSTDNPLQTTGHGDFVVAPDGRWWMVFLAVRHTGYPQLHHLGRETCLVPVEWDAEGWPVINGGRPLPIEISVPDLPAIAPAPAAPVRDDFDAPEPGFAWNFRRNPLPDAWSLTRRPGRLALRCAAAALDDVAPMAFLGCRQRHFDCRAETTLDFNPAVHTEEAGLAVQMNERHYAALVVTRRADRRVVLVRHRYGLLRVDGETHALPVGSVGLRIRAEEKLWHLEALLTDGWRELAAVETRFLSTELAGGFTGVYFALFASGNGVESPRWAEFDWFDYEPLPVAKIERRVEAQTQPFWRGPRLPAPILPTTRSL